MRRTTQEEEPAQAGSSDSRAKRRVAVLWESAIAALATALAWDATSLIGPPDRIRERLAAWKQCGDRGSLDLMLIPSLDPAALTLLAEEML